MAWRIRIKDRALEWHVAAYTMFFGLWLSGPEQSLNPVTLRAVLDMVPESVWAIIFALVGAIHLVALAINGSAWWTPFVRTAAAGLNLFAYVLLAFAIWSSTPWSSGVPTYTFIAASLVTILFRAMRECFLLRRAWRDAV